MTALDAAKEAARQVILKPNLSLDSLKKELSKKYKIPALRNSDILREIPKKRRTHEILALLKLRPVRTVSGIASIAVMSKPLPCPGKCIYCPGGIDSPKSYTGDEPAAMRGKQNAFDPKRQVSSRIKQLSEIGHTVDKCELIVMGGTFNAQSWKYQRSFVKGCLDSMNKRDSRNLEHAKKLNETSKVRAVGITFETRPDYAKKRQIDKMLTLGATRIELGVQTLSDEVYEIVNRGHKVEDVVLATKFCKDSALKVCYHMMPGLFSTPKKDVAMFKKLFSDSRFRPDMLKIYPCMVVAGTKLYDMWKRGEYEPYETETAAEVLAKATKFIPPYVRIMRVQRDIPLPRIVAGVKNSNLRQIVEKKLAERGERCACIRCRESALRELKTGKGQNSLEAKLCRLDYGASGGKEIFLSYESESGLFGFLRLRKPNEPFRKEINITTSLVRELHVYGSALGIGKEPGSELQHRGFGKALLLEAERIATEEHDSEKLVVISGVGAREYYYKLGYKKDGVYVSKKL
ncbi:MAG: tRNA uridine(34) 5-carboxymethylaminomethyl modification radical SAM/GNAT enzyme Elp3 [Candidatus Micrarchaeota archaeon]